MKTEIAIIYGSPSSEHEVSVESAKNIINFAESVPVEISKFFWEKNGSVIFSRGKIIEKFESLETALFSGAIDKHYVINAVHGQFGENGYLQNLLDKRGISYSGPSAEAAKISFDKNKTQKIVQKFCKVPRTIFLKKGSIISKEEIEKSGISLPFIIKPNEDGSSIGVSLIKEWGSLNGIVLNPNQNYLIQEFVEGVEVSNGVVETGSEFWDLPITEIEHRKEIFDYDSKYSTNGANEITPARLTSELTQEIKRISREVHSELKIGLYSRSDFIIKDGQPVFLEINSLPGMTANSILPKQLRQVDKYEAFLKTLLRLDL